ncbi:PP2C family protein-serine/threonine phosphatase [Nonomuraea sp. ATR24]|uniref:PP2C family protein-serine/threonine phosphatase n=1 Tax=Nonomuraea TaxID=83681 RepID=UPI001C5F742A|nr:PP2C family protein-serine/threonine phosphatase [Nonomuraea ceibae]
MTTDNDMSAVYRALRAAPPYRLGEAARDALVAHTAATGVELLLADYALTVLRPVLDPPGPDAPEIRIDASERGRVFASQRPAWDPERGALHLPMSACGERLGVLSLSLPAAPGDERIHEFHELASALAAALWGAGRVTDRYRRARRLSRLTLAAEMQWELLPGYGHRGDSYDLAGQLEPAYAVHGDNFDWSCDRDSLMLSVTNGMGEGLRAALLTSLAVTAIRNARRSGADLVEQAGLADEVVHAQYGGREHVSTLLLRFDAVTGEVAAVEAGSPRIFRLRGAEVETVKLDAQLPLGMFGATAYVEQPVPLQPGDRLVIVSDGVYGARSTADVEFGAGLLETTVRSTRLQPAGEAVRTIVRDMMAFRAGVDVIDDAVVVCLDWTAAAPARGIRA